MFSIACIGVLLAVSAWLGARRPFLVYLLALLLVAYVWRLTSVAYIDVKGPLYAIELFRDLGGNGRAAPWLTLCYLLFLGVHVIVFRPSRVAWLVRSTPAPEQLWSDKSGSKIANLVAVVFSVFLTLLFADLLRGGVIPLFAGIERYVFTALYGGGPHQAVVKYGMHLSFLLGLFYAAGALRGEKADNRFLLLLLALFFYLLLVGNRFSAYYSHTCFFLIPWAAVAARRWVARRTAPGTVTLTLRSSRWIGRVATAVVLLGLVLFAQGRSLLRIRGIAPELVWENLTHRILVVQGELWWTTYERVIKRNEVDPSGTFDRLFVHPVIEGRNSTIPFLMEKEIGALAYPILDAGNAYTGGYPEILFELLGPWLGFAGVLLMAYLTARLLFSLLRAILMQSYIRIVLVFYVAYAFVLFSGSGMLNIFSSWKFLVKVGAVLGWLLYEAIRDQARLAGLRAAQPVPHA